MSRMGEKSSRAGDVFFGAQRIDFIFDSVVLAGDSNDARAVHGTGGGAQRGEAESQVIPGKIESVCECHDGQSSDKGATQQIHRRRTSGQIGIGHGVSLQAKGRKWDTDDGDCRLDLRCAGRRKPRRKAQVAGIGEVSRSDMCCTRWG